MAQHALPIAPHRLLGGRTSRHALLTFLAARAIAVRMHIEATIAAERKSQSGRNKVSDSD
jgi:hypothetical protein